MKNFNDKPQRPQPPQSKQSADRRNPPQFGNKPLIVKDYNIAVFFIYNLFFAPPLGGTGISIHRGYFPILYAIYFRSIRRRVLSQQRPYALCSFDE